MIKHWKQRFFALCMCCALCIQQLPGAAATELVPEDGLENADPAESIFAQTEAPEDVSALLESQFVVVQDGAEMQPEDESSVIHAERPVEISASIKVPVLGDGGTSYVKQGDEAEYILASSEYFKFSNGEDTFDLTYDGVKVGRVSLLNDKGSKQLQMHLLFNGDEEVFDGTWSEVECTFDCKLDFIGENNDGEQLDTVVTILDKNFQLTVPESPIVLDGTKTGERDGDQINWCVKLTATKGSKPGDFSGYEFEDDLSGVGSYVDGSFAVYETEDEPHDNVCVEENLSVDENSLLRYTFPDETVGERYVCFSTAIDDTLLYTNGDQTITNSAYYYDTNGIKSEPITGEVSFTVNWIEKSIESLSAGTGEIQWAITANHLGVTLPNAVITDEIEALNSKQIFVSADLYTKSGSDSWNTTPVKSWTSYPEGGKFALDQYNNQIVYLIIKARVDNDLYNWGHNELSISNQASLSWDQMSGGHGANIDSDRVAANIGMNPISKKSLGYNAATHSVEWEVTVKQSYDTVNNDLRTMDLLVYGPNGSYDPKKHTYSVYEEDGNTPAPTTGALSVSQAELDNLQFSSNQRYLGGFDGSGLTHKRYVVKDEDGNAVADLLLVTGITVSKDAPQTYTFQSEVTNPAFYLANNTQQKVWNNVFLFSGYSTEAGGASLLVNKAEATQTIQSKMLDKDVVSADTAQKIKKDVSALSNVNASSGSKNNSFDYLSKTAMYRIHLNHNSIDGVENQLTANGTAVGAVTAKEQLPTGWQFEPILDGKTDTLYNFLLYQASYSSGNRVTATELVSDPEEIGKIVSADFTDGSATFHFKKMDQPYMIIVQAGPTDEYLLEMCKDNIKVEQSGKKDSNIASLYAAGTGDDYLSTDFESVTIDATVLDKKYVSKDQGVATWEIIFKPFRLDSIKAEYFIDTLPTGLDVPIDSKGHLDTSGIAIEQLQLQRDGSYKSTGVQVAAVSGETVFYDNAARSLKFMIPEDAANGRYGYRFTYQTIITANGGAELNNSVSLYGGTAEGAEKAASIATVEADAAATMKRLGYITIQKENQFGAKLAGVEFALFAADTDDVVIRSGVTDANGQLTLRGLPAGKYILRELTGLPMYESYTLQSYVTVALNGRTPVMTITSEDDTAKITGSTIKIVNKLVDQKLSTALCISKTLRGNAANPEDEFSFTLTAGFDDGKYAYTGAGGKEDGELVFTDKTASFKLKGGQSITLTDLPKDVAFSVAEDADALGYTVTSTGTTGTITEGQTLQAAFMNTRETVIVPGTDPDHGPDPTPDHVPDPTPDHGSNQTSGHGSKPTPDPDIDIDDPDVPLSETPEITIDDTDVPLSETPEITIDDPDVPLSEMPEITIDNTDVPLSEMPDVSRPDDLVGIADEETPLGDAPASIPKTGDNCLTVVFCFGSILCTLVAVLLTRWNRKKKRGKN